MFDLVKNETDIKGCSGRKKIYEYDNDGGKKGNKYTCAFETMKDPGCGSSFFFGGQGSKLLCYCESIGSACPRTTSGDSSRMTEYRITQGKLV